MAMPIDAVVPEPAPSARGKSSWTQRSLWLALGMLVLIVLSSVVVRVFSIGDPNAVHLDHALQGPTVNHLFGTDNLGRDVLLRTLYATVTDLTVGFVATYVPLVLGLLVGAVAGYSGGKVDAVFMRATDFVLTFPFIVLVIAIIAIVGPGLLGVYIGLILKGFPPYARLARAEMLTLRERQFILAARTLGYSRRRIVLRHALPHVVRPCLVFSLSDLVSNMLLLASLTFLGLGIQPPTAEWGSIIADGQPFLLNAWWICALPGLFVVVVGVALSLVGEGLADRLHVRTGAVV